MKVKDILTEARRLADIEDEMGAGLDPVTKALMAKKKNIENKPRASERVKQLQDEIYDEAVRVYSQVRVYKNFGVEGANVKVGGVRQQDRNSREVQALNARLEAEHGIVPRNVRRRDGDSVLYHIPYDMFDQDEHDNETNI